MIRDILYIGQEIRNTVSDLQTRNTLDRYRLANLLEHLGQVLLDAHTKLATAKPVHSEEHIQLLSEEVFFKLAVLVTETPDTSQQRLLRMGQQSLRLTTDPDELVLLHEAANHFLECSKELRAG